MAESELSHKSLTEDIIQETLRELESYPEFDSATIQSLKKLASDSRLTNAALITEVIQQKARKDIDENPRA